MRRNVSTYIRNRSPYVTAFTSNGLWANRYLPRWLNSPALRPLKEIRPTSATISPAACMEWALRHKSRPLGHWVRRRADITANRTGCRKAKAYLCRIWGSHGCDYAECRLLGYKTPVRTSQETHYVSATEPSLLMLCKIWGFTAMTMKNAVLWDMKPYGSCVNRRFGETHRLVFTVYFNR
jgi:hypothetical protein